jgi:pimeloyl-ACP methyl ester carboxylesterase
MAVVAGCSNGGAATTSPAPPAPAASAYFDNTGRDDVLAGGVKMIPINTPKGMFRVWTKRVGNNPRIAVPTLAIGARYDTMDPKHMEMMASKVQKGRYLYCPNGSHLAIYDDQQTYMNGVVQFLRDVDGGTF